MPPARALHSVYSHRRFPHDDDDDDDDDDDEEEEEEEEVLIRGEWGEDEAMAALRSLTRPPLTPHNPNSALRLQSVVCKCKPFISYYTYIAQSIEC